MKDEKKRISDLLSYKILDTPEEEELNELAEIASLMLDAPIALITMVDAERQWFKAKKGIDISGTRREDSFCRFTLEHAQEVFVVEDAREDDRFTDNPLVTGEPFIRFYAGAPLVTPEGNVLGTLCLLDPKPKLISETQKAGLKLLAKRAMDFLNARKLMIRQREEITASAEKLIKLTENIPGTIFQLRRSINGKLSYDFISPGNFELPDSIGIKELKKKPEIGFELISEEYRQRFMDSLEESYRSLSFWSFEYCLINHSNPEWYMVKAKPEKQENGDVVWYGIFHEITSHIIYEEAMEQMAFDISHVLRKPIANLMGLSDMIQNENNLSETQLKEYVHYIIQISDELNNFTKEINEVYQNKWNVITKSNDKLRNKI